MHFRFSRGVMVGLTVLCCASSLHAQGWRDKLKQKVKEKISAKMDTVTTSVVDTATVRTERVVHCVVGDKACLKKAAAAGKTAVVTDTQGQVLPPAQQPNAAAATVAQSAAPSASATDGAEPVAFINYDFVPGDKVLFAEDFSDDKVGDIPSRVKLQRGNVEIADWNGGRFLRTTSNARLLIPLPKTLPEKFTVEFDVAHSQGWNVDVYFVDPEKADAYQYVQYGFNGGIGDFKSEADASVTAHDRQVYHARLMVDGGHAKVYMNGKRVANVPEAKLGRSNAVWIELPADDNAPAYITNIRIAESQRSLFDALNANGRVATHGILFDTNSDRIRAESAPTLQQIGDMLTQHPDLKLTIEGHTDNVGQAAANLSLSQRRADAVKQYLVSTLHVDASRLQTKGLGDTAPAASNATPEGRQQNRRVELVKI